MRLKCLRKHNKNTIYGKNGKFVFLFYFFLLRFLQYVACTYYISWSNLRNNWFTMTFLMDLLKAFNWNPHDLVITKPAAFGLNAMLHLFIPKTQKLMSVSAMLKSSFKKIVTLFQWLFLSYQLHGFSDGNTLSNNTLRKKSHIRRFSGPYFPAFELNTERYSVSLQIQPKCGKMRSRKTPNTDTFHADLISSSLVHELK